MSIRHFIEGTKEYHQMDIPKNLSDKDQHNFIKKVLEKLDTFEDIVVTFKLVRAKVQKNYYTFCTLFKINNEYLREKLAIINKTLNLGIAGRYRKLNLHMLRRYFASTLSNPVDGDLDTVMPSEYIDAF